MPRVLLGPLCLFKFKPDAKPAVFPPGVSFSYLKPELRRTLLDVAKAKACSDQFIEATLNSTVLVVKDVPISTDDKKDALLIAMYRNALEIMVHHLLQCFFLFERIPDYRFSVPWFTAEGTAEQFAATTIAPQSTDWPENKNYPQPAPPVIEEEQPDGTKAVQEALSYWPKLERVARLDLVESAFIGPGKVGKYITAGNENRNREAEKWAEERIQEGQWPPPGAVPGEIPNAPSSLNRKWFFQGVLRAYREELAKQAGTQLDPSKIRWERAAAIFRDAVQHETPYRLVTLTSCLESLLSQSSGELTFQLASRTAWLTAGRWQKPLQKAFQEGNAVPVAWAWLAFTHDNMRRDTFEEVTRAYNLRSKIVHGDEFKMEDAAQTEVDLEDRIRSVFAALLDNDRLFDLFTGEDRKALNAALKDLSLGIFPAEPPPTEPAPGK